MSREARINWKAACGCGPLGRTGAGGAGRAKPPGTVKTIRPVINRKNDLSRIDLRGMTVEEALAPPTNI